MPNEVVHFNVKHKPTKLLSVHQFPLEFCAVFMCQLCRGKSGKKLLIVNKWIIKYVIVYLKKKKKSN